MLAQDDRVARGVGAVTMVLIAGAIVFAMFFYRACGRGDRVHVDVSFHHAGGLREGAPVVVGGHEAGDIESIGQVPDGVIVRVGLDAELAARLGTGGDVFVASKGMLSDKYLEFGAAPANTRAYREGDQVVGRDPPTLDRVMQRTWEQLEITRGFLADVKPEANALMVELARLADGVAALTPEGDLRAELLGLAGEARRLRDVALGGEPGFDRITAVIARARATVAQAKQTFAALGARADTLRAAIETAKGRLDTKGAETLAAIDRAIASARAAFDKIDPLLAQVQALNERLARGEGSLGRLMKDPEFPEDAKDLGKILKREPWKIFAHP